ncbi:hypothetical protein [Psychrobacter sp. I-STPA6b]|uniref:hypothetical protein n=1 Tax=Psychrobacter sp. I-STPA6b TaxID=2585718 RepID=UPI001D0C5A88|nr:hypothetical protein [Psychrobacter sp. I-STPA6b]
MPDIDNLLNQSEASFKPYTEIHKTTFYEVQEAMQQHEAQKPKSGRLYLSPKITQLKRRISYKIAIRSFNMSKRMTES